MTLGGLGGIGLRTLSSHLLGKGIDEVAAVSLAQYHWTRIMHWRSMPRIKDGWWLLDNYLGGCNFEDQLLGWLQTRLCLNIQPFQPQQAMTVNSKSASDAEYTFTVGEGVHCIFAAGIYKQWHWEANAKAVGPQWGWILRQNKSSLLSLILLTFNEMTKCESLHQKTTNPCKPWMGLDKVDSSEFFLLENLPMQAWISNWSQSLKLKPTLECRKIMWISIIRDEINSLPLFPISCERIFGHEK